MKIVYFHNTSLTSIQANIIQVVYMCKAFSKLGHKVILITPYSGHSKTQIKNILLENYNIKNQIKIKFFNNYTLSQRINKYLHQFDIDNHIKSEKPDICYVRNSMFLNRCLKLNIKTIFECHNNLMHDRLKILNNFFVKNLIKNSYNKNMIKFVTISKNLSQFWISKGINMKKLITLHDGFDEEFFEKQIDIIEAKKRIGLNPTLKYVVYTGSLNPSRDINNILFLARNLQEIKFLIIGGPNKYKIYWEKEAIMKKIYNITFLDFKKPKEIPNYLFAADVLLAIWSNKVNTINYCSPLKLFEYMASGRNIVINSYPTIKEVLTDRKNAIFTNPNDQYDLLIKTKYALNINYPSSIANETRKLAFEKYSWKMRAHNTIIDII